VGDGVGLGVTPARSKQAKAIHAARMPQSSRPAFGSRARGNVLES
jgi:hypothetical protein